MAMNIIHKRQNILETIADFSTERLIRFLYVNGLGSYAIHYVIRKKNIDGATFLNLNEFEINGWEPLITRKEVERFLNFLTKVKSTPEQFRLGRGAPSAVAENTYDNKEVIVKSPDTKSVLVDKLKLFEAISSGLNISREELEISLKRRYKANGAHVEDENDYGNDLGTVEFKPTPFVQSHPNSPPSLFSNLQYVVGMCVLSTLILYYLFSILLSFF